MALISWYCTYFQFVVFVRELVLRSRLKSSHPPANYKTWSDETIATERLAFDPFGVYDCFVWPFLSLSSCTVVLSLANTSRPGSAKRKSHDSARRGLNRNKRARSELVCGQDQRECIVCFEESTQGLRCDSSCEHFEHFIWFAK